MSKQTSRVSVWVHRLISILALLGMTVLLYRLQPTHYAETKAGEQSKPARSEGNVVQVDVVSPRKGGLPRTTTQPGSVHAFEDADLYSQVYGYLTELNVDIGSKVDKGMLLARIDVPEVVQEVAAATATVEQKKANVTQAQAKLEVAEAEKLSADAAVDREKAALKRDEARKEFNVKRYKRFQDLKSEKAIDDRLVEEKEDQWLASLSAVDAAQAALQAARVNVTAAIARVGQAKADVGVAQAELDVAKADLAKAEVRQKFGDIVSPYTGVITVRNVHVGYFIRDAQSGGNLPLLRVERTDLMRVIVQIPDIHVPYTDIGDKAEIRIDALPGKVFSGTVSRLANSEDHETRTMRTEIDLDNKDNLLRDGMYGRVTVILEESTTGWTVPSSAVVGRVEDGQGEIYVVRDGRAHRQKVQIGADDGRNFVILSGIDADSKVVTRYKGAIGDNVPVQVSAASSSKPE